MQKLFIILSIISVAYIVFRKRRFDYYSIAVFSAIIYLYPAFYNRLYYYFTSISLSYERVSTKTFILISIFVLLLLLFTIFNDSIKVKLRENSYIKRKQNADIVFCDTKDNLAMLIVAIIGLVLGLYTVLYIYGGFVSKSLSKMEMLQNANRITEYFKYIALFAFVYAFVNEGKYINMLRLVALTSIIMTFLLGHRSLIALGVIAVFTHYASASGAKNFFSFVLEHKIAFLGILFSAFFFLYIKGVFFYFMEGDYQEVISRLTNPNYYLKDLMHSEADGILLNLQNCTRIHLKYGYRDLILQFLFMIPVFGKKIVSSMNYKSFDYLLNLKINVKMDEGVGLGATYLGEMYTVGGLSGYIILIILTFVVLLLLNKNNQSIKNGIGYTLSSIVLVYITFYLHRNSLGILLTFIRAHIYIWGLIRVVRLIVGRSMVIKSVSHYTVKNSKHCKCVA